MCQDWGLTVDRWLGGGAGMPVLAVRRADGIAAVLKIAESGALDTQVRVLELVAVTATRGCWTGRPTAVPCYLSDWATICGPSRPRWPTKAACSCLCCRTPGQCHWPVELPFQGKAAGLLAILADLGPRYGTQHKDALVVATSYAKELAASERAEVVCHGDPHAGNVLRRGAGWALIDPDGFVGERAYDLGVVMRDACREISAAEAARPGAARPLLHEECGRLAGMANADPERVWRWAFVERVTTGLYLRWFGHARESATFLDTAALLAT